ncbi:MAG: ERF family protein [Aestuariivirga sp.]
MNAVTEVKADHKSIFAALAAAQMEMGPALKDSANPAFRSKYADLASVMQACMGALNRHGICVMQPTGEDEAGRFVRTILAHTSGETVECRVPLIIGKNDMQGYGSAVTYARRYGLMSMAGIAPEDDDGNAAAKAAPVVDENAAYEAEISQVIRSIGREGTLESLAAFWTDLNRTSLHVAQDRRVIKAKDDRKTAICPPATADDEVPY